MFGCVYWLSVCKTMVNPLFPVAVPASPVSSRWPWQPESSRITILCSRGSATHQGHSDLYQQVVQFLWNFMGVTAVSSVILHVWLEVSMQVIHNALTCSEWKKLFVTFWMSYFCDSAGCNVTTSSHQCYVARVTKSVLTSVSDGRWWRKTLKGLQSGHQDSRHGNRGEDNVSFEKQACHPFYQSMGDNSYANTVSGNV